ncbi:polysaccharide deacetylase family protein [Sphaerisporangium melleum]|nr:polysaccharide deacetylase family protein [Sphaerisporangium melleum]
MSRWLSSGGVAVIIAVTTGCGISLPSHAPPTTLPAQPTTINFVDPASVPGLAVRVSSDDSAPRHVFTAYPVPPAAAPLGERLRRATEAAVRGLGRPGGKGGGAATELNVGWQITAASGGVYGVRLRTGTLTGSAWRNSLATYWYDARSGRVHDSAGLLKDGAALARLAALTRARLGTLGPPVRPAAVRADRDLFDSLNFNPRGDLVAEFDDGRVAPARMGRIAVAVPRQDATPLLSEFGLRVMTVVDSATPPTLPASPPPEFTPSPEVTGPDRAGYGGGGLSGGAGRAGGRADCSVTKCVALTFDDGPGPRTRALLAALAEHHALATFFTLGAGGEARPDLLRAIAAAGHLIANHTWTHRDLAPMDVNRISDELNRTQIAIGVATGRVPRLMRAPYGSTGGGTVAAARALNLAIVGWDVDAGDARDAGPAAVARRTVARVRPGSIVLLHEQGPATVPALREILARLTAKGYAFVTVPELYGSRGMDPGRVYGGAEPPLRRARHRAAGTEPDPSQVATAPGSAASALRDAAGSHPGRDI